MFSDVDLRDIERVRDLPDENDDYGDAEVWEEQVASWWEGVVRERFRSLKPVCRL